MSVDSCEHRDDGRACWGCVQVLTDSEREEVMAMAKTVKCDSCGGLINQSTGECKCS